MKKETVKKIIIAALVLFVIGSLLGTLVYFFPKVAKKRQTTPEEVELAIKYINNLLKEQGERAILNSWEERDNFYVFNFEISGMKYQSFVTKDGKYLFPYGIELKENLFATTSTSTPNTSPSSNEKFSVEVEKKNIPDVKLFVMSYCPFGLQMEKALLPVWELLKEKAEIGIYFVDYIMHGKKETEENLRQYCIQKEEKEKFLAYLSCFVKEGKTEDCLIEAKIDQNKLNSCQEKADKEFKISENSTQTGYPPFNVHKDLNEKYGVKGSPTLVINDRVVYVERSPEKIKEAICNAFLNPPPECEQKLSDQIASPGFGTGSGSSSGGSCQ